MIMPRAACAELIALRCAGYLLAMSRSDRRYACNLRGGGKHGDRERTINRRKQKDEYTTRTYIPVSGTCIIPGTIFERSTAQHDAAPQLRVRHGTACHRTALRCAAELYIAGLS